MKQPTEHQVLELLKFKNPPRALKVIMKAAADNNDSLPVDDNKDNKNPFCLCYHTIQLFTARLNNHRNGRIRLDRGVHDALKDLEWLTTNLASRPTHLTEITELPPTVNGACDAAGPGMGGVVFNLQEGLPPRLWRSPFSSNIQQQLVSFKNPRGTITNSDLELGTTVLQQEAYLHAADLQERTTHTASDNTLAMCWQYKGSSITSSPPAYLLRLQSLHQRFHCYKPTFIYLPGLLNKMADDCLRLWHLNDSQLLSYFNLHYPQSLPWPLWHAPQEMLSAVTLALRRKPSEPASFLRAPPLPRTMGQSLRQTPNPSNVITQK
mmetsp:Transcript_31852/g.48132  ORF Transcript_31852/g.48132 Transcript_31852/m.48132 type:complete len:322 (-) Transcript_31852:22-987(-)